MVEPFSLPSVTPRSHFSQVPNEIIAKIFAAGTEMWIDGNPSGLPFPDLVSGVCRHWRVLSHGTPNLWTFILPPFDKNHNQCCMWMSKWLERSRAMPIAVVLDDTAWALKLDLGLGESGKNTTELLASILVLLEECAHRVRRLDIRLRQAIPLNPISRIISRSSQLQQLSLCQWFGGSASFSEFQGNDSSWLRECLSLIKLRFQGLSLPHIAHVTSLDIHDLRPTYSDVQTLFGANCCLKYLVLHNLYPISIPIPAEHSPIRVDSLFSIAVSSDRKNTRASQGGHIFYLLDMPNITYLELDCNVRLSVMFGKSLSTSKVDTLKISNRLPMAFDSNSAESNNDVQILQSFSGLRHLELSRVSATLLLAQPVSEPREMSRKRSIGSRMGSNRYEIQHRKLTVASPMVMTWPELRSIVLHTVIAEDVVSLIGFIQCHKAVHTVQLSTLAMRHLSGLKRKGETVLTPPQPLLARRSGFEDDEEGVTQDVHQWLSKLVNLKPIPVLGSGLLKTDADPLSDMP